jgi:hypothetical protein
MDMKNLQWEDIHKYTRVYMWGDEPKNTYPAEWQLHPEDAHTDAFCWVDHTDEFTPALANKHWACCHCGCGQPANNWYVPGHDQKHYGALLREWGMAVNNSDRLRIIRNAQEHTTNGVWSKFMNRTGFTIERGYAGEGDLTYVAFHDVKTAVTKVGRWYYPVVYSTTGRAYRSSKPIKDTFEAGHTFDIKVSIADVELLWDIMEAQKKEKEEVAA